MNKPTLFFLFDISVADILGAAQASFSLHILPVALQAVLPGKRSPVPITTVRGALSSPRLHLQIWLWESGPQHTPIKEIPNNKATTGILARKQSSHFCLE